jgi:hypothetical protein
MLKLSGKIIRWFVQVKFRLFLTGVIMRVLTNADIEKII